VESVFLGGAEKGGGGWKVRERGLEMRVRGGRRGGGEIPESSEDYQDCAKSEKREIPYPLA